MEKFVININKEIFDENSAKISVLDRGFLYGDSVYEATRTFNRQPFMLEEHIERLFISAGKIYLNPTITKEDLIKETKKTIDISPFEDAFIRIILTRGNNSDLGLDPALSSDNNLVIMLKEIKPNPAWWYQQGVSMIFYHKKTKEQGSLPKAGNYIENMLAYREARRQGAFDAIMVNPDGHITEGTTSNIWLIKNQLIITPSLAAGVLEGITRQTLLKIMPTIKVADLTMKDFLEADECFLSSTTRDLIPVVSIDNHPIGIGKPGPQTLGLLTLYREHVRKDR